MDPDGAAEPGRQFGCASFNQDSTSLALGTRSGYKLFSLTSVEKLDCIHESGTFTVDAECCCVPQRLVVFLEESIYVHNIKDMKLLKTLLNTPSNPSGLCALSTNQSSSYLAYPGSVSSGDIIVHDTNTLSTVAMIPAHDSPLAALAFDASATKLASASERGYPAEEEAATWTAYMGKMFSAASSYLPGPVSGMMSQDRAFATVHLVSSGQRNVCTLVTIQKLLRLLVATADGQLFIYNVDPQEGGECQLAYQHRLLGVEERGTESEGGRPTQEMLSSPSYAQTAALPSPACAPATLTGYSEDGGARKGEVIPEHEFAAGPVCLDDENEFPPVSRRS
ncbi:PREDICTED: WD repeat domain phosphoinositide-interacting protein 1-like [Cyprinodon variegatus]|uniref:WD repeat domain phosphoinositide-interacting protein 1-like n=1 Tax=Cyprinodon variegatus TaxID=28743 RepID=UPI000742A90A|nr:PREDICTED: WD repeat domain phosphoinositide-interacting protein 1-like [Cyprinodon variegatus]